MAWVIVFERRGHSGERDTCLCFTKYETSLQVKRYIDSGIAVHEIREDGRTRFDRAQVVRKFGPKPPELAR